MIKAAIKGSLKQLLRVPLLGRLLENEIRRQHFNYPAIRFAPPGHFYSPLPDLEEVEKKAGTLYGSPSVEDGVQLNADGQRGLLVEFSQYSSEFDWGEQPVSGRRYYLDNVYFGQGDAVVLYSMIRHFRPRRIIEVGSGHSSALMLDVNERFCDPKMELCFIEPYPDRLQSLLREDDKASVQLLSTPVQDVPLHVFDRLGPNDILFIDSSHVAKVGSDVNHLFFEVLPRLQVGVLVHIHDIFYPFEYPIEWLREGRAWNEIYLLRAFLQYSAAFQVIFFNAYLWHQEANLVKQHLPLMSRNPGGSIWLRKGV